MAAQTQTKLAPDTDNSNFAEKLRNTGSAVTQDGQADSTLMDIVSQAKPRYDSEDLRDLTEKQLKESQEKSASALELHNKISPPPEKTHLILNTQDIQDRKAWAAKLAEVKAYQKAQEVEVSDIPDVRIVNPGGERGNLLSTLVTMAKNDIDAAAKRFKMFFEPPEKVQEGRRIRQTRTEHDKTKLDKMTADGVG